MHRTRLSFSAAWNTRLIARLAASGEISPSEAVRAVIDDANSAEVRTFGDELLLTLGHEGWAVVTGIEPTCRYLATSLIATALGGLTGQPAGPLGGEVATVVTSTSFDHNLAWHTDSTSWERPNRWQTLTLVQEDEFGRPAPTSVLRWSALLADVSEETQNNLRTTLRAWRRQFLGLPSIHAPVLGHPPRWLRPALDNCLDDSGQFGEKALADLDQAVRRCTDYHEIELTTSSVVVFDNHAVLHRGPHLAPDGGRTIIRLKIGGLVGDLEPGSGTAES